MRYVINSGKTTAEALLCHPMSCRPLAEYMQEEGVQGHALIPADGEVISF